MKEKEVKRVLAYIRCSTFTQAVNGMSLEVQEEQIKTYIEKRSDWELVGIEQDNGKSGKSFDRPGIKRAIKRIEAGELDIFLVSKIDRVARNTRELLAFVYDVLEKNETSFVSINESIDTTTPAGEMFLTNLASFATFEGRMISLRVREAHAHARAKGIEIGGTPYGLTRKNKRLVEVPEEMRIVRTIKRWRSKKEMSYLRIARRLNELGIASKLGKAWTGESVRRVVLLPRKKMGRPRKKGEWSE